MILSAADRTTGQLRVITPQGPITPGSEVK